MNIQQLEYILAVDTYRHFAKAAGDDCPEKWGTTL